MLHRKRIYLVDGVLVFFFSYEPLLLLLVLLYFVVTHRLNILFIDHIVCGARKTNLRYVRSLYTVFCALCEHANGHMCIRVFRG